MKCVICKTGEIHPGRATVTLQRGGTTIVIKEVPADICDNCGEYFLSEELSARVLGVLSARVRSRRFPGPRGQAERAESAMLGAGLLAKAGTTFRDTTSLRR